jgi:hypothetical protein
MRRWNGTRQGLQRELPPATVAGADLLLDMTYGAFDHKQTVANGARDYAAYSSAITAN